MPWTWRGFDFLVGRRGGLLSVEELYTSICYKILKSHPVNTCGVFQNLRKLNLGVFMRHPKHQEVGVDRYTHRFRDGSVKSALKEAHKLEEFRVAVHGWKQEDFHGNGTAMLGFPFQEFFPSASSCWPALRRLHLEAIPVMSDALVSFLLQLPPTLDTITLKNVQIIAPDTWRLVIEELRQKPL